MMAPMPAPLRPRPLVLFEALEPRPLALDKQGRRPIQAVAVRGESTAGPLEGGPGAAGECGAGGVEALTELALVRNDKARCRGRRRRADIGGVVAERPLRCHFS